MLWSDISRYVVFGNIRYVMVWFQTVLINSLLTQYVMVWCRMIWYVSSLSYTYVIEWNDIASDMLWYKVLWPVFLVCYEITSKMLWNDMPLSSLSYMLWCDMADWFDMLWSVVAHQHFTSQHMAGKMGNDNTAFHSIT